MEYEDLSDTPLTPTKRLRLDENQQQRQSIMDPLNYNLLKLKQQQFFMSNNNNNFNETIQKLANNPTQLQQILHQLNPGPMPLIMTNFGTNTTIFPNVFPPLPEKTKILTDTVPKITTPIKHHSLDCKIPSKCKKYER